MIWKRDFRNWRKRPTNSGRLPGQLFRPMDVSKLLRDEDEFPALAAFLRDFDDSESEFRAGSEIDNAYEEVKSSLRRNAGARGPRRT